VLSHRFTVRSSRPKNAPISFHVSSRRFEVEIRSIWGYFPICPDLSLNAVCPRIGIPDITFFLAEGIEHSLNHICSLRGFARVALESFVRS
jgi:hypothetical protein